MPVGMVSGSATKLKTDGATFVKEENEKWKSFTDANAQSQVSLLTELEQFTEDPAASKSIIAVLKANMS